MVVQSYGPSSSQCPFRSFGEVGDNLGGPTDIEASLGWFCRHLAGVMDRTHYQCTVVPLSASRSCAYSADIETVSGGIERERSIPGYQRN